MAGLRAENVDARMKFQWRLEIPGLNITSFKECKLPDSKFESAEYPAGLHNVKQPGKRVFGDMTAKRVLNSAGPDLSLWQWHNSAGDPETGKAERPSKLKRQGTLKQLDSDGTTVLEEFTVTGLWPKEVPGMPHDGSSDIQYEEITFSVDFMTRKAGQ